MAEGVVIRRIIQHQPNGFIFQTRDRKLPAFKVLLDPRNPALYVSGSRPPVEAPVTDFLMVLRQAPQPRLVCRMLPSPWRNALSR